MSAFDPFLPLAGRARSPIADVGFVRQANAMMELLVWQVAALANGAYLVYGLVKGEMFLGITTFKREENDYAFWLGVAVNAMVTVLFIYLGLGLGRI